MTGAEAVQVLAAKARTEADVLGGRLATLARLLLEEGRQAATADIGAGARRVRLLRRTLEAIVSRAEGVEVPEILSGPECSRRFVEGGS